MFHNSRQGQNRNSIGRMEVINVIFLLGLDLKETSFCRELACSLARGSFLLLLILNLESATNGTKNAIAQTGLKHFPLQAVYNI